MRILVVDDDPLLAELIQLGFDIHWREVEVLSSPDGESSLEMVERERPDLVLLDIILPGIDGYEALRRIREFSDVPVIVLTGRDSLLDRVKGLELGADDYLAKPFEHLELVARMKAILRRRVTALPDSSASSLQLGDLSIDPAAEQVRVRGKPVLLTGTEYRLLYHLARNAGQVLPYQMLLARAWGDGLGGDINSLRTYIWRLRQKVEATPQQPRIIMTERGVGYRFRKSP